MAAFLRPDGPRAPGVPRPGDERVVRAFAERVPDGVDGREVQDVEAQFGQPGDLLRPPPASPPKLRGNSSYQAPNSGPRRSTQSGAGGPEVRSVANFGPARAWATGADKATFMRLASSSSAAQRGQGSSHGSPVARRDVRSHVGCGTGARPRGDRRHSDRRAMRLGDLVLHVLAGRQLDGGL